MPQLTPINLLDKADPPVAHQYIPSTLENGKAVFLSSQGVPVGDKKLTVSTLRSQSRAKVELVLVDPVLVTETVNGVARPIVDRTSYATVKFNFPVNSTLEERQNVVGKMAKALAFNQPFIMSVCEDLEGMY